MGIQTDKKCPKCGSKLVPGASYCPRCGSRIFQDSQGDATVDPYIGKIIDDTFEVRSILGTGSMGIVYKAYHRILNCDIALKVLRHDFLNDRVVQARFQREAQAVSSLSHPNIIRIMHFGRTFLNAPYIAMECLHGQELATLVSNEFPLSPWRVCNFTTQIAHALSAAHHANIIHRDLKPANIFVEEKNGMECIKVLDFGIAKIADVEGEGLTREGAMCGTPAFTSPEQIIGKNVTPRADIFSLGSTLYFMLTCRLPFQGDTLVDMSRSIMADTPTPPSKARLDYYVPPQLEYICFKALQKDPDDRFQSADEMAAALDAILPLMPVTVQNVKPQIVVGNASPAADAGEKTECLIDAYDDQEDDEEGGTVVEMPAYPSAPDDDDPMEETADESSAISFAISEIASNVLPIIKGKKDYIAPDSKTNLIAIKPEQSKAQRLRNRKRFLLGLVCLVFAVSLFIVLIMLAIYWLIRPNPDELPQKQPQTQTATPLQTTKTPPTPETPSETIQILTDKLADPTRISAGYGAIFGLVQPASDLERIRKNSTENQQMHKLPPSNDDSKTQTTQNKKTKSETKKQTAKNTSKSTSSPKISAKKNKNSTPHGIPFATRFNQAMKLEAKDKAKACAIYRQLDAEPGISQAEKLKVKSKVRNCTRISL